MKINNTKLVSEIQKEKGGTITLEQLREENELLKGSVLELAAFVLNNGNAEGEE